MSFRIQTVCDYHTLKTFNQRHLSPRRAISIVLYALFAVLLFVLALLYIIGCSAAQVSPEFSVLIFLFAAFALCIFMILQYTVFLERALIKQAQMQGISHLHFSEAGIADHTENKLGQFDNLYYYTSILKVTESPSAYYLYIQRNTAIIVSKYGFTEGDPMQFIAFLGTVIDPRRIKLG